CSISRDSTLSSAAVADLRASSPLERPLTSLRSQRYWSSHRAPHFGKNNFLGVDFRLPSSPESDHASSSARVRSDSDDGRRVVLTRSRRSILHARPISLAENREPALRNPLPACART